MDNQVARPKMSKESAGYKLSSSPAEHRCGICSYYLHLPGTKMMECGIVYGRIDPMMGCKYFDVNLIKAANDPITLLSNPPQK